MASGGAAGYAEPLAGMVLAGLTPLARGRGVGGADATRTVVIFVLLETQTGFASIYNNNNYNMNVKNEIRTLDGFLSVRESEGESRTIFGRAIVFNSESVLLDGCGMKFREVIAPEAVTMDFLKTQDIKLNMLHDRMQTVARWKMGTGSLRLSVDKEGVSFEFDAPRCDLGERCLEMVRRGDYSGCSFEFFPDKYEVVDRGKDDVLVVHRSFAKLRALTIGLDPAYTATTVNARELYQETDSAKAEAAEYLRHLAREHDKADALLRQRARELELFETL